jgi:hypothetical protein
VSEGRGEECNKTNESSEQRTGRENAWGMGIELTYDIERGT